MGKVVYFALDRGADRRRNIKAWEDESASRRALHHHNAPSVSGHRPSLTGSSSQPSRKESSILFRPGWWLLPAMIIGVSMWVWIIRMIISLF